MDESPYSSQLYGRLVNWDDIPDEQVRPGVRRKAYATNEMMMVLNHVSLGAQLNPHVHEDFDQLAIVLGGIANYYLDGVPNLMRPGSLLLVRAGVWHYIDPLEGNEEGEVANMDIFFPPRTDYGHLMEWANQNAQPPAQEV